MIGSFGWMELLLILFIVLIIFGAGKIPQLGEGLGKAIKGFKKSVNEPEAMDVTPPPSEPVYAQQPMPDQLQEQQTAQAPEGQVHVGSPVQGGAQEPQGQQPPPPPAQG